MKVYVATPVTSRKEATLDKKFENAKKRIKQIISYLDRENLCMVHRFTEYVSTFSVNPSVDDGEVSDGEALGRCVALIMRCDAVIIDDLLEKELGIESKGMYIEKTVALLYMKKVFYTSDLMK